ncbi:MAG TPA: serine/threonine-protein kinase [Candidatus Acidoferrales bacterium]|nr:serine/threonine-protein kinase [Candidatus Acidoferrales bacterium]
MPGTEQAELKKLGKYELIEIVGRGAMGEVYKAQDPLIGRLVALKTITKGLAGHPDLLERFNQEARSAGTLQHPNIVTVYELGQEGETPFIAMEFLEGESLESLIERRPTLSIQEKLNHIIPVCRALNFAHKRGVIHRDIKPANVMLTKEGRIKVVDFGIARQIDSNLTQTDSIIGTLAYMSPQQIRGERADARADIWATGVMLYELLAYQRPFDGPNQAALVLNISKDDALPPSIKTFVPDCGPALEAVVDKMLAKNIQQRYQNMEQVLNAFEGVMQRLRRSTGTRTVVAGDDLVRTRMATTARPASKLAPTVAQTQGSQAVMPAGGSSEQSLEESSAATLPSAAQPMSHKRVIGIAVGVIVVLLIARALWQGRDSARKTNDLSSAASVFTDQNSPPTATSHKPEPIAPGVVATEEELSQPWASKEFIFHNALTGSDVPALVVHLPRGGYWGFSLIEPYGTCRLEYVTDLQKLATVYGYRADHPLIADPCNKSLFDLLRYGGPIDASVRGDIVSGASVRPPIAVEIQQRGNAILATEIEPQ